MRQTPSSYGLLCTQYKAACYFFQNSMLQEIAQHHCAHACVCSTNYVLYVTTWVWVHYFPNSTQTHVVTYISHGDITYIYHIHIIHNIQITWWDFMVIEFAQCPSGCAYLLHIHTARHFTRLHLTKYLAVCHADTYNKFKNINILTFVVTLSNCNIILQIAYLLLLSDIGQFLMYKN